METVKLSKTERLLITNLELLVKRVREAHVDADGLVNDCPVCVSLVLSEEAIKSAKKNSSHYELLEALKNIVAINGVGYGTDVVQFVTDLQPLIADAQEAIRKAETK